MSPHQPDGIIWPKDGHLEVDLAEPQRGRPFSIYVHVPFCTVRCGYCDFNTYTAQFGQGADHATYADSVIREIELAATTLNAAGFPARPVQTIFFGGGTPTLLPAAELARILDAIRAHWSLAPNAEVTSEANPETVDRAYLQALKNAGVTRVSVGMQSAVPHVLATLDRTHTPTRVPQVVQWAKDVGLDVSLDLIYGTPGESLADWQASLEAAIAMDPDHISAYALVVEEGTKMGAQVARGDLPTPDPDDEADKYELADQMLAAAGYQWYEISNFARLEDDEATELSIGNTQTDPKTQPDAEPAEGKPRTPRHASQHNLAYWRDWDWWGFGPGAHSHVGRLRWWNVKHPTAYAGRLAVGESPAVAGEELDEQTRELERVLLGIRTYEGLPISSDIPKDVIAALIADELIEAQPALQFGRIRLTLHGRLLADHVTHRLMGHSALFA